MSLIIQTKNIKSVMNDFYKTKTQIERFNKRFTIIFNITTIFIILVFIMVFSFNLFVLYKTFN